MHPCLSSASDLSAYDRDGNWRAGDHDSDRGRALEQQIGAFLTQHGYAVRCNVMVEGRSGARHELDVVGDKSDGLTTFRLVVECKAWKAPIDKRRHLQACWRPR